MKESEVIRKHEYTFHTAKLERIVSPSKPPEHYAKEGDWVWCETCKKLVVYATSAAHGGMHHYPVRPLTDADWTGEIGSMKVRAQEFDEERNIEITFYREGNPNDWQRFISEDMQKVARKICAQFNIPIKPWDAERKV